MGPMSALGNHAILGSKLQPTEIRIDGDKRVLIATGIRKGQIRAHQSVGSSLDGRGPPESTARGSETRTAMR